MELIERTPFLNSLQSKFSSVTQGEGHSVFVSGEAGIGKTSLVKTFCKQLKNDIPIYQGTCDALFTPRPLAPLYDIALQMQIDFNIENRDVTDRAGIFARFFQALSNQKKVCIIVFEDIHWADEATLDFIKFLARRITQLQCFFILTYRDDEISSHHPLRNVLGHVPPDSFTRLQLTPLSREVVKKMAEEKGYNGEDLYSISGGNPFYVTEILANYSKAIPESINDAILSIYNRTEEKTREVWNLMSVIPDNLNIKYLEKFEPSYAVAIESCLNAKLLIINNGFIFFKHELFRRTIEAFLSPMTRISLNKRALDLLRESFEQNKEIERIIHYAKNANEYDTVVHYAPIAARKAAAVGAHIEASKLYLTAIECYHGNDKATLNELYEGYAYECYLTSNTKEAIIYAEKSLRLWKEKNDNVKTANCLRFLSRLWWFAGNRKNAECFAEQAIEVLNNETSSSSKAMAFSNMAQLKMLSDESAECIMWGEKAIAVARELGDEETLCHALNNVGCVQMKIRSSYQHGTEQLQQSLEIALKNSYHDHVARAYTNIAGTSCNMKNYLLATKTLDDGINYCEERDLDAYTSYMLSWKARLNLETGFWNEAFHIAENLFKNEDHTTVVKNAALSVLAKIKIRRGDPDTVPILLEAKTMAFEMMELQKIIPVVTGLLEYEWITGNTLIETEAVDSIIRMFKGADSFFDNNEFAFWLLKAKKQHLPLNEIYEGYDLSTTSKAAKAAALWKQVGNPYMEALALFEASENDKRKAITIIHDLGANAVYEKMKLAMRTSGIKSIPRGIRKSTQSNSALITGRELDVLTLLKDGMRNKEIASQLFISAKTVDNHISSILFKFDVNSRAKAVTEAVRLQIIK